MDQDSSPSFSPADYWNMLLRRKWIALGMFALCVAGAGVLCVVLPVSYRSSTLILVEGQKIPEKYVQAVIGPSIEERLNSLQQQVMSRTVLTKMIEEFDLYPQMVAANGVDAVVEMVRKDIKVETMGARSQRGSGIDAFSISFAHENPMVSMKVTSKLASQFIEENLKVREQLVAGASEFLEQELALSKDRLELQEKTISQYKTQHMGELPEQVQANISALDRLQLQHSAAVDAIQKSTDRLTLMDKMIKEYESPQPQFVTTPAAGGAGRVIMMDPLATRLNELEKNLTALSAEYKDTYPDIVNLKQEIQSVKVQLKEKTETTTEKNEGPKETPSAPKVARSGDLYLRELMKQRDEAKLEIVSLKERLTRTRAEMSEYEKRVEKAPTREQELEILVRDYNNLKENYRTLLDKKLNARLAENLERRQKGEQFRIVDPANLPTKPEKPDRMKIMLLGLLLGCGLGAGSAVGLELIRPVFRRSEDVESLLHLKVIASIPSFKSFLNEAQKNLSPKAVTGARRLTDHLLESRAPTGESNGKNGRVQEARTPVAYKTSRSGRAQVLRELEVIGKWNPWSVVSEQFRVAATRVALQQYASKGKVTMITSAVKGEGKSVVAANLAYAFARDMGKRTLLVDGDLKCPTAHEYWGIPQWPGFRDVLQDIQPVESCLRQEGELPLWIMPSGTARGRVVDDLSRMDRMKGVIEDLKKEYDFIIVDAPPVLPLADMHFMAGLADLVVFVVRAGLTPRSVVEGALHTLGNSKSNMCIILNELEVSRLPYYMQQEYELPVGGAEVGPK